MVTKAKIKSKMVKVPKGMGSENIVPKRSVPWMGTVESPTHDKHGKVTGSRFHLVRIECEHWAPHLDALDCRFGCERTKRMALKSMDSTEALYDMEQDSGRKERADA